MEDYGCPLNPSTQNLPMRSFDNASPGSAIGLAVFDQTLRGKGFAGIWASARFWLWEPMQLEFDLIPR